MNYRQTMLLAALDITTAGTKTIELDQVDMISRINVIVELTNSTYAPQGHPIDAITKVQVVDGSEIICSLEGFQAAAASFYGVGKQSHTELNYENNAICRAVVPLDFGRFLYDPELALDPTRFKNLQLKITHSYLLGACTPDTAELKVSADMFDEKSVNPKGYLMTKEHYSFTPTAGAAEPISIPTDYPIRFLMPIALNDAEEPDIQMETIKLDTENNKRVLFDLLTMDIIRNYCMQYPKWSEYFSGQVHTTPKNYYFTPHKDLCFAVPDSESSDTYTWVIWTGGRLRTMDSGAVHTFQGSVTGLCPHGSIVLPMGNQMDIDDWWDVRRIKSARLTITPRSSPAIDTNKTTDLVIQQFRPY